VLFVLLCSGGAQAIAQDAAWRVAKSSGDVAIVSSSAQPIALTEGTVVKPGDAIRTGRNGRVLLSRGEESILIEPNSVVGIPAEKKDGLSTTILQKSGSILLDVEKRNVQHFQVETPYLAAVVKGTQFRVTVKRDGARVDVVRGQVEVADFKSGKFALVLPGQVAQVSARAGGLSLSGSGTLGRIQQGTPRAPSVMPAPAREQSRPLQHSTSNGNPLHIAAPLGEVKLDINKATQGLARASAADSAAGRGGANANASASGNGNDSGDNANAKAGGSGFSTVDNGGNGGGNGAAGGIGLGNNGVGSGNGGGTGGAVGASGGVSGGGSASNGGVVAGVLGTVNGVTSGLTKKLKLSDTRLKRDIVPVGRLVNGLGLYRYRYLWSDTAYVGVMAQEVELVRPDAVVRGTDGFLRVDYDALGLTFQTFDEWTASSKAKEIAASARP
jgi:hypothetical protein